MGAALQNGYALDNPGSAAILQEVDEDEYGAPSWMEVQVHGRKVAADRYYFSLGKKIFYHFPL